MNKIFKSILFLTLTILSFNACLDEIDLDVPSSEPIFTVSGNIYTTPGPYSVFLSTSAQFSAGIEGFTTPISNATVIIRDDKGNEETLTEVVDGEYQTAVNGIQGTVGNTYELEVQWNGQVYKSSSETLMPVVSADSLSFEVEDIQRINEAGNFVDATEVSVLLNTSFPPSDDGSYLRWTTFGIYEYAEIGSSGNLNPDVCYVTEDIDFDNVVVASSNDIQGNYLQSQKVITRDVNFKFTDAYCFNVVQHSITASAYEFWSAVAAEFERSGNIFETPPATLRGNIYNPSDESELVLGYFGVSATDTIKILVLGPEVGNPSPQCVPFPPGPPPCYDCLLLPNSTYAEPECWQ